MSDGSIAGRTPRLFDDYAECDGCGTVGAVAITLDGRYCWECIPDDELTRLLRDLTSPYSS